MFYEIINGKIQPKTCLFISVKIVFLTGMGYQFALKECLCFKSRTIVVRVDIADTARYSAVSMDKIHDYFMKMLLIRMNSYQSFENH